MNTHNQETRYQQPLNVGDMLDFELETERPLPALKPDQIQYEHIPAQPDVERIDRAQLSEMTREIGHGFAHLVLWAMVVFGQIAWTIIQIVWYAFIAVMSAVLSALKDTARTRRQTNWADNSYTDNYTPRTSTRTTTRHGQHGQINITIENHINHADKTN